MLHRIIKFLDKFYGGNQLTQWGTGRWFVQYSDGTRSVTMFYSTAKDYASIFNGTVKHISERLPFSLR